MDNPRSSTNPLSLATKKEADRIRLDSSQELQKWHRAGLDLARFSSLVSPPGLLFPSLPSDTFPLSRELLLEEDSGGGIVMSLWLYSKPPMTRVVHMGSPALPPYCASGSGQPSCVLLMVLACLHASLSTISHKAEVSLIPKGRNSCFPNQCKPRYKYISLSVQSLEKTKGHLSG